jgi:hypothetical protein
MNLSCVSPSPRYSGERAGVRGCGGARLNLALTLAFLLAATPLWSDEPAAKPEADPCETELTEKQLDNPPERKTKFEVVEEALQVKLVDVKAADQKFVAQVRIVLPRHQGDPYVESDRGTLGREATFLRKDARFRALMVFSGQQLLYPPQFGGASGQESAQTSFARMLAEIPEDRALAREDREFFSSEHINRLVLLANLRSAARELYVLGSTAAEAEARARTLLTIFDQGFSRPIQKELFKLRTELCRDLKAKSALLAAAVMREREIAEKLKAYEEFTPDMLAGLRVQQLQLEVDLAGVRAKLETCEKLLQKLPRDADRRKQIEDAKVSAEIELSGFEARRAKSAEFITKLKDRNTIAASLAQASTDVVVQSNQHGNQLTKVRDIDAELAAFGPVRILEDRVTIHPLEWTR